MTTSLDARDPEAADALPTVDARLLPTALCCWGVTIAALTSGWSVGIAVALGLLVTAAGLAAMVQRERFARGRVVPLTLLLGVAVAVVVGLSSAGTGTDLTVAVAVAVAVVLAMAVGPVSLSAVRTKRFVRLPVACMLLTAVVLGGGVVVVEVGAGVTVVVAVVVAAAVAVAVGPVSMSASRPERFVQRAMACTFLTAVVFGAGVAVVVGAGAGATVVVAVVAVAATAAVAVGSRSMSRYRTEHFVRLAVACTLSAVVVLGGGAAVVAGVGAGVAVAVVAAMVVIVSGIRGKGEVSQGRRAVAWTLLAAALLGAGFAMAAAWREHRVATHPMREAYGLSMRVVVTPTDDPKPMRANGFGGEPRWIVRAALREYHSAEATVRSGGRVVILAAGTEWGDLLPGQPIEFRAQPQPPKHRDLTVATLHALGPPKPVAAPPWWQRAAASVRDDFAGAATAALPPDAAGLIPALVLGDTSGLPEPVRKDFETSGLQHLCVVSGANFTILLSVVLFVVRALSVGPRVAATAAAAALLMFVVVARPDPSVLRAAAMGAVTLLALVTGRRKQALPALCAAVIGLLLVWPELAVNAGFALSVLATAGLILLAPGWADWLRARGWWRLPAEVVAVSAAAFTVTVPIMVALTGRVSVVAILANVLVAPAIAPITVVGALGAACASVWSPLAELILRCAGPPLWWLLEVAERTAALPGATITVPAGSVGGLTAAALVIVVVWALRAALVRRLATVAVLAAAAVLLPARLWHPGWPPSDWVLAACDIGQGDGLALATGPGTAIVIDVGPDPRTMRTCLDRLRIHHIALLALTHPHADHIGGLTGALHGRTVAAIATAPGELSEAISSGPSAAPGGVDEVVPSKRSAASGGAVEVLPSGHCAAPSELEGTVPSGLCTAPRGVDEVVPSASCSALGDAGEAMPSGHCAAPCELEGAVPSRLCSAAPGGAGEVLPSGHCAVLGGIDGAVPSGLCTAPRGVDEVVPSASCSALGDAREAMPRGRFAALDGVDGAALSGLCATTGVDRAVQSRLCAASSELEGAVPSRTCAGPSEPDEAMSPELSAAPEELGETMPSGLSAVPSDLGGPGIGGVGSTAACGAPTAHPDASAHTEHSTARTTGVRAIDAVTPGIGEIALPARRRVTDDRTPLTGAAQVAEIAGRTGIPLLELASGHVLRFGAVELTVLAPAGPGPGGPHLADEPNDSSLVIVATTPAGRILFTGDIESPAQLRLLREPAALRADILKVPHHGSRTTTSEFLAAVRPRLAIISSGADNTFGHPHPKILTELHTLGTTIARTDLHGDVLIAGGPSDLRILTTRSGPST